jgi:hypothetical protein
MASNTVKCVNCNVVINELLAFLWNVLDVMDEESVHRLCTSSFSPEDITKSKKLLFESVPSAKKVPNRRKDGKKKMSKELDDIICLMKGTESELFPVFVAKDLHKIPPVSFDHVDATRILKDILRLQNQINAIEDKFVSVEQFDSLRKNVEDMKYASITNPSMVNVNRKRGAYKLQDSFSCDSGPIGLEYVPIITQAETHYEEEGRSVIDMQKPVANLKTSEGIDAAVPSARAVPRLADRGPSAPTKPLPSPPLEPPAPVCSPPAGSRPAAPVPLSGPACLPAHRPSQTQSHGSTLSLSLLPSGPPPPPAAAAAEPISLAECEPIEKQVITADTRSFASITKEKGEWRSPLFSEEWEKVQRKRLRNRFTGSKGIAVNSSDNNFKAADTRTPIYIYNVSTETTEGDIINYIQIKTSIKVEILKWKMKSHKNYSAFKIFVPKEKIDIFLCDTFWPQGVSFRRFFTFRQKMEPPIIEKTKNHLE